LYEKIIRRYGNLKYKESIKCFQGKSVYKVRINPFRIELIDIKQITIKR